MIQPSGNIPVAEIDGVLYTQSNDIMGALERLFPERSVAPLDMSRARELLQLERQLFSAWMYWLTGSSRARSSFELVLQTVEEELGKNKPSSKGFFMGDEVTYVDFMYAPFLERIAASLLYYKAFQMRYPKDIKNPYPNINKWFQAMETLEAYLLTKSDYYTHVWDLPPQLGGCVTENDEFQDRINGKGGNGSSWSLPLSPHNYGLEPDWDHVSSSEARLEVVERLSHNYQNIVKFAARGAGTSGFPSYSAPLSDPNAASNDSVKSSVDAILRIISNLLLNGDDTVGEAVSKDEPLLNDMNQLAGVIKSQGSDFTKDVVDSLIYLRDRVGVPRDMKLPSARLFRAYLNWSIGFLE